MRQIVVTGLGFIIFGLTSVRAADDAASQSAPATAEGRQSAAGAPQSAGAESRVASAIEQIRSNDTSELIVGVDRLGGMGAAAAAAVPALAKLLDNESAAVRAHTIRALGKIGEAAAEVSDKIAAKAEDPDAAVRRAVIGALVAIAPNPQVSLQPLGRLLGDAEPPVRIRAVAALADMGEAAVPTLIKALENEDSAEREGTDYWAMLALAEIGPKAKAAVPALAEKLSDTHSPEVRHQAILTLAAIGSDAAEAADALTGALERPETAAAATYALGMIGRTTPAAEKSIRAGAESPDEYLRTVSTWALVRLHPDDQALRERAIETLARSLTSDQPRVRALGAQALGDLRPKTDALLAVLDKTLDAAPPERAAEALSLFVVEDPAFVPRLVRLLEQEGTTNKGAAARTLGMMGAAAAPAVDALGKLVNDKDRRVRREAMFALARIGPEAKPAVPLLLETYQQGSTADQYGAGYALGRIGPAAIEAKPVLQKTLASDDEFLSLLSSWALARIDPRCMERPQSVDELLAGLKDLDPRARLEAAASLRCLGPKAQPAATALKAAAENDRHPLVRDMAAEALREISQPQGTNGASTVGRLPSDTSPK